VQDVLAVLLTATVVSYALVALYRMLRRGRPELDVQRPIAIAFALRIAIAMAVSLTTIAGTLRGGDEIGFLVRAQEIAATPFGSSSWTDAFSSEIFKFVFALQDALLHPPEVALRITQAGFAVAGLMLLVAAVHDLAGPRSARLAAWVLAFEPANVFFSSLLHKEPMMYFAEGLVVYGGARVWKHGAVSGVPAMAAGCLIALATRHYVGLFLISASTLILLHAALRMTSRNGRRSLGFVAAATMVIVLTLPAVLLAGSPSQLRNLQASQDANAADKSNLKLERVDFSTRGAIAQNLPTRIRDVLIRPYPWEFANASQRVGLLGTLVTLATLALLLQAAARNRGQIVERAAPFIYTIGLLVIAYSLAAGNAGTGFRYRTHIVALAICMVVALREPARSEHGLAESAQARPASMIATA
jgi:hypothetical protein